MHILTWYCLDQWKEVPAAQCGPAFTHTELKPTWLSTSSNHGGGSSAKYGGGHQPSIGHQPSMGGDHQPTMGGAINQLSKLLPNGGGISQVWGGHQPTMGGPSTNYGGGGIFPPVCTGSQNPQNYFSNTYVLPSVNRTAGPITNPSKLLPKCISNVFSSKWVSSPFRYL